MSSQSPSPVPAQTWSQLEVPAHLLAQSDGGAALWALEPKGLLRRYDLASGQVQRRHAKIPTPLAWRTMAAHPEGRFLVLCDEDTTQLLEHPLSGGDMLDLPYSGIGAAAVAVTRAGRCLLALAHHGDGVVMIDADTLGFVWQAEYSAIGSGAQVMRPRVRFCADGDRVAVNHGGCVTLHDAVTGRSLDRVQLEGRDLLDFGVSADWQAWALAAYHGEELLLADAEPSAPGGWLYARAVVTAPVTAVAIGPAGAVWAGTSRGGLAQVEPILRDLLTLPVEPSGRPPLVRGLEVSADGRHLISLWSDQRARLFGVGHLCGGR
jgi:hypothetical protein